MNKLSTVISETAIGGRKLRDLVIAKKKDAKGHGSDAKGTGGGSKSPFTPFHAIGSTTFSHHPDKTEILVHHNGEHVGNIKYDPKVRTESSTHVYTPIGRQRDTGSESKAHPDRASAMNYAAEQTKYLPSKDAVDASLAYSNAGTSDNAAYRHVLNHMLQQRQDAGADGAYSPSHVVHEKMEAHGKDGVKSDTHEYHPTRDGRSTAAKHINTETGSYYHSYHYTSNPEEAHHEFKSQPEIFQSPSFTTQNSKKKGGADPARQYVDADGEHTYFPAKDRGGFYGMHSYGSRFTGGGSSVSHHPDAKTHADAHVDHLKARRVIKMDEAIGDLTKTAKAADPKPEATAELAGAAPAETQ